MASHAPLFPLSLSLSTYSIPQQVQQHHHHLLLISPPRQSALSTNGIPPVPTVSPNDPDLISRLSPRFRLPHWRGWLFLVFNHVFIPDPHCHCGFSSPSVSPSFGNLVGSSSLGSLLSDHIKKVPWSRLQLAPWSRGLLYSSSLSPSPLPNLSYLLIPLPSLT
ncbi:hypothetical protein ASPTUDRAFT_476367 [Aspergillus tubingensis CBS 134.48]|uniref:Uncharacterized protein n=1 Tax=Aspergillus tubingensis (strain CBS 134.48) TaxID=767770 RepID=A0A1L9NBN1_ASPTC|nr:hypothetical protein ASPTUDRAFT_476367 [Aspergillus tubingensis CBS 134.48]